MIYNAKTLLSSSAKVILDHIKHFDDIEKLALPNILKKILQHEFFFYSECFFHFIRDSNLGVIGEELIVSIKNCRDYTGKEDNMRNTAFKFELKRGVHYKRIETGDCLTAFSTTSISFENETKEEKNFCVKMKIDYDDYQSQVRYHRLDMLKKEISKIDINNQYSLVLSKEQNIIINQHYSKTISFDSENSQEMKDSPSLEHFMNFCLDLSERNVPNVSFDKKFHREFKDMKDPSPRLSKHSASTAGEQLEVCSIS